MTIASPWPFIVINLACFALAWLVLARSAFYRELIASLGAGRAGMIDGLRGWLALGVFFSHTVDVWFYHQGFKWGEGDTSFYGLTGPVGVCLFFMITGFLFWTKVLRGRGNVDAMRLYRSRIRRLVPMYLASVLGVLLVVAVLSDFSLHEDPITVMRELRNWLSFGFLYGGDLNGIHDAHYINAVYWTLAYEWAFYLALPFLGVFAGYPACLVLFALAVVYGTMTPVVLNFVAGAAAAVIIEKRWISWNLDAPALTPVAIACLVASFAFPERPLILTALLFVFFLFVVHGNSLFGLLASGPSKLLGTVSYSIYLTHCIVLYSVMHYAGTLTPLPQMSIPAFWGFAAIAALVTVLISSVTYRWIEHPFLVPSEKAKKPVTSAEPAPIAPRMARAKA
jgi:peptidoglycan/LPS O-acetylase OafA/YrhL